MRGSAYQSAYERKLDSVLNQIDNFFGSMPHEDRPFSKELHKLYEEAEWYLRLIRRN